MRTLQRATGTILFAIFMAAGGCGGGSSTTSGTDGGWSADADGGRDGILATTDASDTVTREVSASASSSVVSDGYVTTGPWAGYGFTATDPGAATIIPQCDDKGCTPPYVGNSFCMHGTVTGRKDYTGFAMLGWNVNQGTVAGAQLTWPVPATGGIIVTVDNPSNTSLRVQLQGTNPHSSADRWCAPLVSGKLIPWDALLTNCWEGGSPKNPLTPGTPIQQAAIIVPGLQTDLPFDLCLVDVEVLGAPANVDGGSDDGGSSDGLAGAIEAGLDGGYDVDFDGIPDDGLAVDAISENEVDPATDGSPDSGVTTPEP